MTILDALKGLYAKLGGKKSPDNIQTIGEALEDITGVAVNGSDALPAVTATDNGDVLTVVEGAWAKAVPSGGGLTPHIHISYANNAYTAESDVPFADLIADWDSENWKFSTYDLVYVTDDFGVAVKCEVVDGAIVAFCMYPATGVEGTFVLSAYRYTWNGTTVTQDDLTLVSG